MRGQMLLAGLGCISLGAGKMACADEPAFHEAAAVADSALDEVRGGFETPANLHASLTLERTAYLNGELIVSRSVSIPDIGNMTPEQADALAAATGTLLVQNGPNNAFNVADLGPASTVIQNTLNDQHLVTLTTLSVEVNSLSAFRELHFQDSLQDALTIPGVR
jgi:hypothetical protein